MSKADLQAIEKKIAEETKNVEQAKGRLQQLHARKSALSEAERTRRLILIGKVIVAKAEREQDFKACLMKWLDEGITAERDRALFDLARPEESQSNGNAERGLGRPAVAEKDRGPDGST